MGDQMISLLVLMRLVDGVVDAGFDAGHESSGATVERRAVLETKAETTEPSSTRSSAAGSMGRRRRPFEIE